jgi:ubiquinone/menaquinone biosynthesis C-methylase UbiE
MPGIVENLQLWNDRYPWPHDGDEWQDQAEFCGVLYQEWKDRLIRCFILHSVHEKATVLEIGCGHGRWTEILVPLVGSYIGVDIAPRCVKYCMDKFQNAQFIVNDGSTLHGVENSSIDFVWSFDTFVHIELLETRSYLRELARVLRGTACIHHPGFPTELQRKGGWRSKMTAWEFEQAAREFGLVVTQTSSWGQGNRCNTKRFGDCISVMHL